MAEGDSAVRTALAGKADLSLLPGVNLLGNWYFVDPINQRNVTTLTGQIGPQYVIDRWQWVSLGEDSTFSVINNGIEFFNGNINQYLENDYSGKTLTMSILFADGTLKSGTNIFPAKGTDVKTAEFLGDSQLRMWCTHTSNGIKAVGILAKPGYTAKPVAAKLELGSHQTLAHQDASGNWVLNDPPPNKALELAKCQRYFIRIPLSAMPIGYGYTFSNGNVRSALIVPQIMRANPTLQINSLYNIEIRCNGKIYNQIKSVDCVANENGIGFFPVFAENVVLPADQPCVIRAVAEIDLSADL